MAKSRGWIAGSGLLAFLLAAPLTMVPEAYAQQPAAPAPIVPNAAQRETTDDLTGVPPGEGGGSGDGPAFIDAAPDTALVARLLLIKSYLAVGRDLFDQRQYDDAVPHFAQPLDQVWDDVSDDVKDRGGDQLRAALERVSQMAAAKAPGPAFEQSYQNAQRALARVIATVDPAERAQPGFVVSVVLLLLGQASDDYATALDNGRVVNVEIYQNGRGFVATVCQLWSGAKIAIATKNPTAYHDAAMTLAELQKAWPSLNPGLDQATPSDVVYDRLNAVRAAMQPLQ